MKKRINLVGMPNQRNIDSLQTLIDGKDQRFKDVILIPVHNPITGATTWTVEKRPGLEQSCLAAFGDRGSNIFYSAATGKTLTFFEDADGIATPYVDCVDVGPFDLDVTPVDRGDGRVVAVTDALGSAGASGAYFSDDAGLTWSPGDLDSSRIWNDVAYGAGLYCAVGNGHVFSTSLDGESWTEPAALPTPHTASQEYNRIQWLPKALKFGVTASSAGITNATLITSPDGSTWTRLNGVGTFIAIGCVAFSDTLGSGSGRYSILTSQLGGAKVRYSDDGGATWASGTATNDVYRDLLWIYGFDTPIFVGCSINRSVLSTDGITFSDAAVSGLGTRMTYNDVSGLIMASGATNSAYRTTDGDTWAGSAMGGGIGPYRDSVFNGENYCACSYATTGAFAHSPDAVNWTAGATQPIANFTAVAARWKLDV